VESDRLGADDGALPFAPAGRSPPELNSPLHESSGQRQFKSNQRIGYRAARMRSIQCITKKNL